MADPEVPLYKNSRFVFATIAFVLVCALVWGKYISDTNWSAMAGQIVTGYLSSQHS